MGRLSALVGLFGLFGLAAGASAWSLPLDVDGAKSMLFGRQTCFNSPTSRHCWTKDFDVNTDFYSKKPTTGRVREYWLSVQNSPCNLDGYKRTCMTFNGTVPGPTIEADWGDVLRIHVTNDMAQNGTAIHWHGIRQLATAEMDGVPGVTQCPIEPGSTMTYEWDVWQYGTTWYHSHFTLQYADGLFGPLILHGPATADYDVDVGVITLQDWGHTDVFTSWEAAAQGAPPSLENTLINGMNTYNCTQSNSTNCVGGGKKYELVFEKGKKYLLRLVNVAVDGHFHFSIDGHKLQVISHDLVPVRPYTTDAVSIAIGQRYNIIVEADAPPGDYWMRGGWVTTCSSNQNDQDNTAIVRYDARSKADPTSQSTVTSPATCLDESAMNLVPAVPMDVGAMTSLNYEELGIGRGNYFMWTINTSSLVLDWSQPTLKKIVDGVSVFPTPYNVIPINRKKADTVEFTVLVIEDQTGFGLNHPIHLHGHDFWVLAQERGVFNGSQASWNVKNPPRRDTATLPGNGYLAIAFPIDNPGAWICHCHIAWHASEGLALEFVEDQAFIQGPQSGVRSWPVAGAPQCSAWDKWYRTSQFKQEDSGI